MWQFCLRTLNVASLMKLTVVPELMITLTRILKMEIAACDCFCLFPSVKINLLSMLYAMVCKLKASSPVCRGY